MRRQFAQEVRMDRINQLEKLVFEDPGKAATMAAQVRDPTAYGVRGCSVIGTAHLLADHRETAEKIFRAAAELQASDFELADLCRRWALLEFARRRWAEGLAWLDIALELHGPVGLPGSLDRGLPAVLAVRGMFLHARCVKDPSRDRLELLEARADLRRAIDLISRSLRRSLPLCCEDAAAVATLLLWRESVHARTIPSAVLELVAAHVRGTLRPDPALHAKGDGWKPLDPELIQQAKPWEIPAPKRRRRRTA
jgi:hypothetical protein